MCFPVTDIYHAKLAQSKIVVNLLNYYAHMMLLLEQHVFLSDIPWNKMHNLLPTHTDPCIWIHTNSWCIDWQLNWSLYQAADSWVMKRIVGKWLVIAYRLCLNIILSLHHSLPIHVLVFCNFNPENVVPHPSKYKFPITLKLLMYDLNPMVVLNDITRE